PLGVAGGAGRGDPHRGLDLARVGLGGGQGHVALDAPRGGLVEADRDQGDDRGARGGGGEAQGPRARQLVRREPGADPGADHAAGERPGEAQDRALREERPGPWHRRPDVGPAPFGRQARRPDGGAGGEAQGSRPAAGKRQRRGLDQKRLRQVEREVRRGLAQHGADQERQRAADRAEEERGAERGAGAEPDARGDERHRGGDHDHQGLEHEGELRDPEVELALEGREPDQEAAHEGDPPRVGDPAQLVPLALAGGPARLDEQDRGPDQRHRGAADQHQVGRAPERDVLAEQAVPDVVEREADQRERRTGHDQDPAEWRVPVAADPDRAAAGPGAGQDDGEEAGGEDAEEAGEDEVVGGVGERPGVAADVDVQGDVPVHPEERQKQRAAGDPARQRRPARQAADGGREASEAAEHGDPPAAVPGAEGDERRGQDGGGGRGADHLADRGAARRCRVNAAQQHRLTYTLTSNDVTVIGVTRDAGTPGGSIAAMANLKLVEPDGAAELTIEQLAAETGMTVRNIRAHQARGLIPPPEVRQRVGYYGPEHVARLRLIRELQAEGFNLRGIKRLLEETPGPVEHLLDFKRLVTAPFETEEPRIF